MSKRIIPQVAKDLMAAKALIEDEENWWCKAKGEGEEHQNCAVTALCAIPDWNYASYRLLQEASISLFGLHPDKANDRLGHSAVMLMFDRAISLAIEEANK